VELTDANARLVAQGFEALGRTLDESQKQLEAEAQDASQAFTQLEAAVGAAQTEAEAAWATAEDELEQATSELAQAESALEAAAAESVQGFDTAGGEFEQRCSDLASDVDLIFDALDAAVDGQGQEWEQHAATLAQEAVAFVESGGQERLEQPASLVESEALSALEQEYSALGGVLDAGTDTAGELEPLAEELVRCEAVVAVVDELGKAMAG
jgi:DNA repair exonuclease SbcCD ATPase subunit